MREFVVYLSALFLDCSIVRDIRLENHTNDFWSLLIISNNTELVP